MKVDLPLERIKTIAVNSSVDAVYLTGGEPFLHPEIDQIIDFFYNKGIKINIATNGLLLNERLCHFLNQKNISLLISLRDECKETFHIIEMLASYDVEVICYHIPTNNSHQLLSELFEKCPTVKKIKLLYDSKNSKCPSEWFAILNNIYCKLMPQIENVNVDVEIAFLPKTNIIARDERRGAFDRIQISTEGLYYYCPLLVCNTEGKQELPVLKCSSSICPVLSKKLDDENFSSVCCFLVSSLSNAIRIGKYGGAI